MADKAQDLAYWYVTPREITSGMVEHIVSAAVDDNPRLTPALCGIVQNDGGWACAVYKRRLGVGNGLCMICFRRLADQLGDANAAYEHGTMADCWEGFGVAGNQQRLQAFLRRYPLPGTDESAKEAPHYISEEEHRRIMDGGHGDLIEHAGEVKRGRKGKTAEQAADLAQMAARLMGLASELLASVAYPVLTVNPKLSAGVVSVDAGSGQGYITTMQWDGEHWRDAQGDILQVSARTVGERKAAPTPPSWLLGDPLPAIARPEAPPHGTLYVEKDGTPFGKLHQYLDGQWRRLVPEVKAPPVTGESVRRQILVDHIDDIWASLKEMVYSTTQPISTAALLPIRNRSEDLIRGVVGELLDNDAKTMPGEVRYR